MTPRIPLPAAFASAPFTVRDGYDAGLGEGRMRGSDLYAPFRGVRVLQNPDGIEARARAFQGRAADDTFFCSITAAHLLSVPLPWHLEESPLLHVAVPSPARSPRARGVTGHKFDIEPGDIDEWHGLRVTTPPRTWCDLATVLSLPNLVAAGDYLIHWRAPITSVGALRSTLLRHRGRRGRAKLLGAIGLLNDRSESPQESLLRVIVVHGGIPGVVANVPIRTSGGFHYRADLALPTRKLIIEYQSRFHDASDAFRADMTRISRLEADGWFVMQVNREDLDNPTELLQRIHTVLRARPHFAVSASTVPTDS